MQYIEQLNNLYNNNITYVSKYQPFLFKNYQENYEENKDAYEYLKVLYIKDLWVTETQPSINEGETEELVIQYIETGEIHNLSQKEIQTIKNINYTVNKYITYNNPNPIISLDIIHTIHTDLMKGLLHPDFIGNYRKNYVKAHNSNMEYANYKIIHTKLEQLINFFNNTQTSNTNQHILKSIIFFSEFLRIHPYKDGNGRTARIIFNYMIQHLIICPISLCSSLSLRHTYINVLEARSDCLVKYDDIKNLIDYIFTRIEKTYITFLSVC